MKHLIFTFALLCVVLSGCKKDGKNQSPTTVAGLYETMVYGASEIQIREITYGSRANTQNLQYTSENTKETELDQATLALKLDLFLPPNATATQNQPLLVMIHGGAFVGGDKTDWRNAAFTYARAGYICASLNYRLTKNGGGQRPQLREYAVQSAIEDIQNAIRYLKSNAAAYFVDKSRIIVFGSSAGGALSLINAVECDAPYGTNDFNGISSSANGSIATGASLVNDDPAQKAITLHYDANDAPVLMFHPKEKDSETGYTWTENALPTQQAIVNSGNSCTLVAQPNLTHTVDLSLGEPYWQNLKPFLWEKLRLKEL